MQDAAVGGLQLGEEVVGISAPGAATLDERGVAQQVECADNVVRVVEARWKDLAVKYDLARLPDLELGSFDVVGEVGIEERQMPERVPRRCRIPRGREHLPGQMLVQQSECLQPVGIYRRAGDARAGRPGCHRHIAGPEQRADDRIQRPERRLGVG